MRKCSEPALACWSDPELGGGWAARARYGAHQFERHVHDELVIVVTESGWSECRTRDGSHRFGSGSVWIFEPGAFHCGRVLPGEQWTYRALYLDAEAVKWTGECFADNSQELLHLKPGVYPDAGLGQTLVAAHRMLEHGALRLERQVAWHSAFELLVSRYGRSRPCSQRVGMDRVRTKRAREFLHEHYDQDVTVDDLAQLTGLSRFHFMRAFQREIGLSPHAYLNQLRLMAAKRHLTQGLRPAEAAIAAGFYDQSHLNRLFKRTFGITPAMYADLRTKHVVTTLN